MSQCGMNRASFGLTVFAQVMHEVLGTPPISAEVGSMSAYSCHDRKVVKSWFDNAGFEEVNVEETQVEAEYDSFEHFVEYRRGMAYALMEQLEGFDDERQAEFWTKLKGRIGPFIRDDGSIRFPPSISLVWSGVKPGGE